MFEFYFVEQMMGEQGSGRALLEKLFPVLTLILGILLNRLFARLDKRRKDKKTAHDLITEIELLEEPLKSQLIAIDELIAQLQERKFETPKLTMVALLNMDRLKAVDRSAVVDHLAVNYANRREALQKANELFSGCDIIAARYTQIQEIVEDYLDAASDAFERWRSASNALSLAMARAVADIERNGGNPSNDPYISRAVQLEMAVHDSVSDVFVMLDKFHAPLTELNGNNRTDPRSERLAECNGDARKAILAIEHAKEHTWTKLKAVRKAMDEQGKKFTALTAELRKT